MTICISLDIHFLCLISRGSQRTAAAGWEVLHDHTCRGCQHTESGRGADSLDIEQLVSRWSGFVRRMTDARDSSDERALHLALRPGFAPGGLWSARTTRGRLHTEESAKLSSRKCSERPVSVLRNREVETRKTGMHLSAERSANLSRKGAEGTRVVFRHLSPLFGVDERRRVWEPGAGKVGGQGALIRPE